MGGREKERERERERERGGGGRERLKRVTEGMCRGKVQNRKRLEGEDPLEQRRDWEGF